MTLLTRTRLSSHGHSGRRWLAVASVAAVGLVAGACSSSSKTTTTTLAGGVTTTTVSLPSATLNGSGSTFQLAFDQEVIQEFHNVYSQITINYPGGGSSKGITDLTNKIVNFAGSDAPANATQLAAMGGASAILYFPTVAAPITVSYNLSGVSKTLIFSGTTLAKIFAGKITAWNDPAIAADNPGVSLPSTKITPVHRSDGSGTTRNFTLYLSKVDPTDWTYPPTTTFPVNNGATGSGNPGVAQTLSQTDGSIAYIDYATAKTAGLTYGEVKNYLGTPIAATLAGASAAVAAATVNADLTYDPTDAHAPTAYPITAPTWILAYKTQTSATNGLVLKSFLNFILTTGETTAAPKADYAPIAGSLLAMAKAQVNNLVIP